MSYRVQIVAPTNGRGWRKLATFRQSEPGYAWELDTAPSAERTLDAVAVAITDDSDEAEAEAEAAMHHFLSVMFNEIAGSVRRPRARREDTVRLSERADASMPILTVVLDALRSVGEHLITVDEMKSVVSQHGGRIAKLGGLPPADHRQRCARFD